MRCEVVAVGTELLLGQIVDTNSSWIGEQLALAGIDSHFQVKVGDNQARIVSCIRQALERAEAVIVCGGLGPTQDDITRECIAEVMGVSLERDQEMADHIRRLFERRGRRFAENNLRQADRPRGALFIAQMPGTAPGLLCPVGDKVIYAVPGVPYEMREMMAGTVLPDLAQRAGISSVIKSRVLRCWGESESGLAEMLEQRIEALDEVGNPTIAFLASGIEGIKIRLTAKTEDVATADRLLAEEEVRVREIVGDAIFAVDEMNMEAAVLDLLRQRGWTLAAAESLTGGLLGARLTDIAGASDVFRGSLVAYASDIKFNQLDVPEGPVISAECARAMAIGARERLGADVGIATTGVAGPSEQEGHAPGTVFVAIALPDHVEALQVKLAGDRRRIREYSVISVLNLLRLRLIGSTRAQIMR
ncbi:MAG: competence/damage-inducible protein A [Gammaproteobacteria bacterium]|nr:competence/damage-inducible protein A [Gammaproteobacteria bacterium]